MASRHRILRAAALTFVIGNAAGVIFAVIRGELTHAATHAALIMAMFAFWPEAPQAIEPTGTTALPQMDSHLDRVQNAVDRVALEVERIGEGQRYVTKVLQDLDERDPTVR